MGYLELDSAAYVGKREKIKPVDEYIKREAVIKGFTDLLQKPGDIYPTDITTMMQRVPAEDVRPVVRGEWIRGNIWSEGCGMGESYGFYYKCSVCKKRVQGDYNDCGMNYCPYCGADTREENWCIINL